MLPAPAMPDTARRILCPTLSRLNSYTGCWRRYQASRCAAAVSDDTPSKPSKDEKAPASARRTRNHRPMRKHLGRGGGNGWGHMHMERRWPLMRIHDMMDEVHREMARFRDMVDSDTPLPRTMFDTMDGLSSLGREATAVGFHVPVDLDDQDDKYVFRADVPGMTKDDIKIQITAGRALEISGERQRQVEEVDEERSRSYQERSYGQFSRRMPLPDDVDTESVRAMVRDGVLTIEMTKTPDRAGRVIDIGS